MVKKKLQLQVQSPSSETGIGGGGVKTYRTLEGGGELAPKVAPRRLGHLTPKLAIFYRISVEKGQIQGPLIIQNSPPPSNFRRFDPPYPGLQPAVGTSIVSKRVPLVSKELPKTSVSKEAQL